MVVRLRNPIALALSLVARGTLKNDPLPSAAELELKLEGPFATVSALARGPTSGVANNAIVLFGEYDGTVARLVAIAANEALTPMTRASAASGLAKVPAKDRVESTDLLVGLTRYSNVTLAANAASACEGLPSDMAIFTHTVDDASRHPAVQRYAQRALDALL
jgi:hypothetical protein